MDAIAALHALHPLDADTLLDRYRTEMGHVTGDPQRIRQNFVLLIREVFGEIEADRVVEALRARPKPVRKDRQRR